ncbi:MAG: hypothetical protein ACLFVO_16180 [Chloroflexaceae bacterium]
MRSPRDTVMIRSSWEEAIAHCASLSWENLCLAARNRYRMRLWNRNKARARQWNTVVDAVKPVTSALGERKINTVVRQHHLSEVFRDTVRWDMLHVAGPVNERASGTAGLPGPSSTLRDTMAGDRHHSPPRRSLSYGTSG